MQVWQTLESIHGTQSRNDKIRLLKLGDTKMLRAVLYQAYNPFRRYYIQRVKVQKTRGKLELGEETFKVLDALASRTLSGKKARDYIENYINHMTREAALILRRIITKDMRVGISSKTINEAFPGLIPIFEVMLAEPMSEEKMIYPCYIGPKIDGLRGYWDKKALRSRKGHKLFGLTHIEQELKRIGLATDGEVTVENKQFDDASGLIRNLKPVPDARYNVFDLPTFTEPFNQRYLALSTLFAGCEYIRPVSHVIVNNEEELYRMYNHYLQQGFEGAMVKYIDHQYERKRCFSWMKVIPEERIDAKVTGVIEGTGKFKGMAGSLVCKYGKIFIQVANRFTDDQRVMFYEDPTTIVGRTVELIMKEHSKFGKLRSGRCVKIREDK